MVSEIQPGQTVSCCLSNRPNAHSDTMGENNTSTAHKGCGVISLFYSEGSKFKYTKVLTVKVLKINIPIVSPGVGFTKGLSLDLDLKSRHLSLNHAKSVVLDLADFTKQL